MSDMQIFTKVLLIDDDRAITHALTVALSSSYAVDVAKTGAQALDKIDSNTYGVIILDLNLPDFTGMFICQDIRDWGGSSPSLILPAESHVLTKLHLLDAGANDYLTKPFSLGELKARVRALIRDRNAPAPYQQKLTVSGLVLNRQTHTVSREGMTIGLRRKEFALLECLMEHAGSVVTRGTLTETAWRGDVEPWTNTVDVHIKYLRDKMDRPFEQPLIQTVHGLGYRLAIVQPASHKEVQET